ncbi:MAG: hypothetical protein K0R92_1524 [Lachnospiraceae bacterium]|nr:hypothetical protein [Lachnospiraceae bacterium]
MSILDLANKYITVPKNAAGIELCEHSGVTEDENLISYSMTQNRLDEVWKTGIIDKINNECDLLIDDFESERIEGDNIDKCLSILSNQFDELKEALEHAKQLNTFVDLDF